MNESEIPIDIHTGKLLEWLVSRRIVPKTAQNSVRDVRNKIANAMKDMPAHEDLVKLLAGSHINYFHCLQIIEILKQTEADTKSVFGTYGSQRMKDWKEIVKMYEKDNIYVWEAAQILVRNVNYEIPGLKKQIAKCDQQSDEALKKIQDLNKTETVLLNEYTALCQQLGIKGDNLSEELLEKVRELPMILSESIKHIANIQPSIEYYAEFTNYESCCPITRYLIQNGNTTVYQYIHKEPPISVEEIELQLNLGNSDDNKNSKFDNEIDFGFDTNIDIANADTVDFGDMNLDGITLESGSGAIDWGEEAITTAEQEVDFDVRLDEYDIVVEDSGMDGGVAKGDQAYAILDSPNYREKFIDELFELESFLKMRYYESTSLENSNNIMFALMDNFSTHDSKSIAKMLSSVGEIITKVMSEQTQHLFQLKHSSKYAEILVSKLKQKINAVEKMKVTKENLKIKSQDLIKQKLDLKPILDKLIEQTKILQNQIEQDISKRYKNRIVNLMGAISNV